MTKKKNTTDSTWIDPDDAPELTEEWFRKADLYDGGKLVRRGRPRKPKSQRAMSISLRLAPKVEKYFRAGGKGWQTRINKALMDWIDKHPR